jgi:hypothetical protein
MDIRSNAAQKQKNRNDFRNWWDKAAKKINDREHEMNTNGFVMGPDGTKHTHKELHNLNIFPAAASAPEDDNSVTVRNMLKKYYSNNPGRKYGAPLL